MFFMLKLYLCFRKQVSSKQTNRSSLSVYTIFTKSNIKIKMNKISWRDIKHDGNILAYYTITLCLH